MLARGELCSEVVQMAVNVCYAYPYGHYNFLLTPSHGEIADDGEDDSHLPEIPQVLRRLSSLAASPKVRVIEGRKNDVAEMLNFKLAQIAREHGDVPAAPKVQGVTARQLFSIGQGNNQWEPDADLLSRPVIGRDEIYVLELVRSVPGNAPNRLDLLKIGLDGQAVRRISTLELPSRPTDSDWLKTAGTVWGRKQCPLRCPQISGGCLYCSLTDRGGIAVFPLDGGVPRMIARGFGEGRPIDIYDEIVVLDKRIFALTLGLPTYIQWYDPDHGGWQVIASSRRLEKKTPLDCALSWSYGTFYDRYHDRLLGVYVKDELRGQGGAAESVYQFSLKDRQISLMKACSRGTGFVDWVDLVDSDRLWFGSVGAIDQYDMKADRWSGVFRLAGNKSLPFADVAPPSRTCTGNPKIRAPYAMADGWLWSFCPVARIAPDGAGYQVFPAIETDKDIYVDVAAYSRTLEYLPQRRALLWGQYNAVWYLQLPQQPDPLPASPAARPKAATPKAQKPKAEKPAKKGKNQGPVS